MTTLLKNTVFILVLFSLNLGYTQNKEIDSLILKIDNKDAYIILTKTISPRVKGDSAERLVDIGKLASPELIKILDHQSKGIIAHFILSKIWDKVWEEEVCCNIRNVRNVEILTINGLEILIENNILYSNEENLKKNQQTWKKITHV
jgi:hypothetical protein